MSYLQIAASPVADFTKAVISLWFRVPKETLTACAQAAAAIPTYDPLFPPHLWGIVPLVTFGQPLVTPVIEQQQMYWGSAPIPYTPSGPDPGISHVDSPVISYTPVSIGNAYIDPSYLGVFAVFDSSSKLLVGVYGNFLVPAIPAVIGNKIVSGCTIHIDDNGSYTGATVTWSDSDAPIGPQPYYFNINVTDAEVFADRWHHLLVSCDLSNSVSTNSTGATIAESTTSYNRMWVALDDVSYDGYDAFPNFIGGDDKNAIITDDSYNVAATPSPPQPLPLPQLVPVQYPPDSGYPPAGTYTPSGTIGTDEMNYDPVTFDVASSNVPAAGYPLGLPATADQVDHILNLETAEFQMFTGVTLATGVEANRRVFLDYKRDAKGQPVADKNGNLFLQPVDPTKPAWNNPPGDLRPPAQVLLGKKADIILHGVKNWKAGKNLGSLGTDPAGKPIAAGTFKPIGRIVKFTPDPGLAPAPQGPPKPGP